MTKRVYIETYGCQMNVADTELMLGVLARDGYERVDTPDDADVMLVNTCAVRDNAEQRVVGPGGRAAAVSSGRATCSAWSAAWRSGWGRRCSSRRRGSTWWSGPMATATSSMLLAQATAGHRVDGHRVPRLGALRGRAAGARRLADPRS